MAPTHMGGQRAASSSYARTCSTPGCLRPSWNGVAGNPCCRTCEQYSGHMHSPECTQKWSSHAYSLQDLSQQVSLHALGDYNLPDGDPDIAGLLEIGEVADLPRPFEKTHGLFITVEALQYPHVAINDVGPLKVKQQRVSEFYHTDSKMETLELKPQYYDRFAGNLQVIMLRVRAHYCPKDLDKTHNDWTKQLHFVGVTDKIEVSWHGERKVYHLRSSVGSIIGNIYLTHRLCHKSELAQALEMEVETGLDNEVEWGSKKKVKVHIFSQNYILKLSLDQLRDYAQFLYKTINDDLDFAHKSLPDTRHKVLSKPPRDQLEVLKWVEDVKRDYLKPLRKIKPTHRIKIQIISAKGVKAANQSFAGDGKSDPFVIVEIPGRKQSRFVTKVINGTLDPVWNEEYQTECALGYDTLQFTVMDKADSIADTLTGTADVELGRVVLKGKKWEKGLDSEEILTDPKGKTGSGKGLGLLRIRILVEKSLPGATDPEKASLNTNLLPSLSRSSSKQSVGPSPPLSPYDTSSSHRETIPYPQKEDVFVGRPQHAAEQRGDAILKIHIGGLRDLSGRVGAQSSNGTYICEIRGKPNSRHEARLGTQANAFEMRGYVAGDVLDFSVMSHQRELLGHASLTGVQFYPRGYDAEMTLTRPKHGIAGLLRAKIVVIAMQNSGNRTHGYQSTSQSASGNRMPHPSYHSEYGLAQQEGPRRTTTRIGLGQSVSETLDRNSDGVESYKQGLGKTEFIGRKTSMAEGRMLDPRESFAMSPSMTDRKGSSFAHGIDPRSSFAMSENNTTKAMRSQSSMMERSPDPYQHQPQRGTESFLLGQSSSMYEGDPRSRDRGEDLPFSQSRSRGNDMDSRRDIFAEDRATPAHDTFGNTRSISKDPAEVSKGSPRSESKGVLGLAQGMFERATSFLSSGSGGKKVNSRQGSKDLEQYESLGSPYGTNQHGGGMSGQSAALTIHIISASGLRCADTFGKSDPYVTVNVPGKPNMTFKTEKVEQTTEPVWNARVEFTDYETVDSLLFEVWDWDYWKEHDFLGSATLDPNDFPFAVVGYDGDLALSDPEGSGKPTLKVRIESSLM